MYMSHFNLLNLNILVTATEESLCLILKVITITFMNKWNFN